MPRKPFTKAGPGRPKGLPNRATIEAKEVCASIVDDPTYRAKLVQRLLAGKLAPAVETMLWHYAHGKPKETTVLENPDGSAIQAAVRIYLPSNTRDIANPASC